MTIPFRARTGFVLPGLLSLFLLAVAVSSPLNGGESDSPPSDINPIAWEGDSLWLESLSAVPALPAVEHCDAAAGSFGNTVSLTASWQNGLLLESADRHTKVRIGGRVQADGTWYRGNDALQYGPGGVGELQDALNFRRARFRIDGTMYETVDWAAEFDFVNATNTEPFLPPDNLTSVNIPAPTDLWLAFTQLPVIGNVKLGNMKPPIGMEHLTSSRFLDFLERSFMQDAFYGPFNNGFAPGIMVYDWDETESLTWAVGAFKNVNNIFASGIGDGEYDATGRVTLLPIYEDDGRRLIHLGISGSHRGLDEGRVRIRSRASLRSGTPGPYNPILADTGVLRGDAQSLLGAELAAVSGPLTLQAEYTASIVSDAVQDDVQHGTYIAQGWYAQALWFLTGEHRAYNRKTGVFDRVVPHENFHPRRHAPGAWQLGVRYALLDLRDSGIDSQIIQDVTLGLNWFVNPNAKLQWNYVWADRNTAAASVDGRMHGFGMRMAYDF